jgi:hypothetical protein
MGFVLRAGGLVSVLVLCGCSVVGQGYVRCRAFGSWEYATVELPRRTSSPALVPLAAAGGIALDAAILGADTVVVAGYTAWSPVHVVRELGFSVPEGHGYAAPLFWLCATVFETLHRLATGCSLDAIFAGFPEGKQPGDCLCWDGEAARTRAEGSPASREAEEAERAAARRDHEAWVRGLREQMPPRGE